MRWVYLSSDMEVGLLWGKHWNELSLILVINQLNAQILVYNKIIICFYMFPALCAHHQEVKIVLYSVWYHHTL